MMRIAHLAMTTYWLLRQGLRRRGQACIARRNTQCTELLIFLGYVFIIIKSHTKTLTLSQSYLCFHVLLYLQDVPKAKQFLPFLQRAGRMEALVEFVASGSRVRLYIPRETCLITFLLSGRWLFSRNNYIHCEIDTCKDVVYRDLMKIT